MYIKLLLFVSVSAVLINTIRALPKPQDFVFPDELDYTDNQFFKKPETFWPGPSSNIPTKPPRRQPTRRPTRRTTTKPPPQIPGEGVRQSPCETKCQTTNQYNPVCGDDNMTYANLARLECARNCGKNVQMVFYGRCSPLLPNGLIPSEQWQFK